MSALSQNKPLLAGSAAALALLIGGGLYLTLNRSPEPTAVSGAPDGQTASASADAPDDDEQDLEGVVELTEAQTQAAGISVAAVSQGGGGGETRLSGRVESMIDARAAVGASVAGTVDQVLVAPGQSVRAGQPLVRLISGDGAALNAEIQSAVAAAHAARQAHLRNQSLADQGVVARQEVEMSQAQLASAEAASRAARARAAAAGAPDASGRTTLRSPIAGVVTSVQVGPGGFAAQGAVVAEVANPARVEMVFNAPPQLAAAVQTGAPMRVVGPQGEFEAVVTGVAADAGLQNSGAAIIRARPRQGALPPAGSPVTGAVITDTSATGTNITVPSEAVQSVDGATVVFVRIEQSFEAVRVLTGRQAAGRTEILRGLNGDERIAASNAFLLKAELAKGEAEHGH